MKVKQLRDHLNNLGEQFDDMVIVSRVVVINDGFILNTDADKQQFVRLDIDDIEIVHNIELNSDQNDSIENIDEALNIMDMNINLNLDNRSSADITIEDVITQ
ncbi:MAG: hypothetical protein OXU23_20250 [Candidatus Poribacteria bacterium]|nr:hypothetical protein [Candidatus Poribacteria bacterium]